MLPYTSRRDFLKLAGAGAMGHLLEPARRLRFDLLVADPPRDESGTDLSGWTVVLGDGTYAAPGEAPVAIDDIATVHDGAASELRANILRRRIMAHNITYRRIRDSSAFDFTHLFECAFRLPYLPAIGNEDENAQTFEGGLFIWDGVTTRLDYGLAFQWGLNPWERFGEMRCWTDSSDEHWQPVGQLQPDTAWHQLQLILDFQRQATGFAIDGRRFPSQFVAIPKSDTWGAAISAGVQLEVISIYPGESGAGAQHRAQVKDWRWQWIDADSYVYQAHLPFIGN